MRTNTCYLALEVALQTIERLGPIVQRIHSKDRNLADQIRRSATSIALNLAEASGSDPGNRRARLHTALGSNRETRSALRIAVAWRYIDQATQQSLDAELDRVAAMTWRSIHPR